MIRRAELIFILYLCFPGLGQLSTGAVVGIAIIVTVALVCVCVCIIIVIIIAYARHHFQKEPPKQGNTVLIFVC
jgi:hypothetical protein